MNAVAIKGLLRLWGLLIILIAALYVVSLYTHIGNIFFLLLIFINLALFVVALLFRNRIERVVTFLIHTFYQRHEELMAKSFEVTYPHIQITNTLLILPAVILALCAVYLSITNIQGYYLLIKEDSYLEYSSALFWLLAAIITLFQFLGMLKKKEYTYRSTPVIYGLFILFFILCAGEEISWGQRILGLETPEILKTVNVQKEITLHNIGSISVFSNAFFLLMLILFLVIPFFMKKYEDFKKYIILYSFPLPHSSVICVFLIGLFVWFFIGIRFGTLGFHPFSFYDAQYYTQMDDEIFEFFAAYTFFCFSIMDNFKKVKVIRSESVITER